jgi:ppGpp synthetase/RelA/SpoT-type nucleotidyltranferase
MTNTKAALGIYKEKRAHYLEFIDIFKSLVHVLISRESKIGLVQISGHLKSVDDLGKEVDILPGGDYPIMSEMQNLMALRVVTFYEKDVAFALRRLTSSFEVSEVSIQEKDDPEAHGYPGSSLLLKLGADRLGLEEYKRFAGMQIEVQVYSLFQDTWSKIAQHIGYPADQFPQEQLREFNQLSYMLELADSELNKIKQSLNPYDWSGEANKSTASKKKSTAKQKAKQKITNKREAAKQAAEDKSAAAKPLVPLKDLPPIDSIDKIKLTAPTDEINQENIDSLILSNQLTRNFDKLISDTYNTRLMYQGKNIEPLLSALIELNAFKNIAEIEAKLFEKRHLVLTMAIHLFGTPKEKTYEHIPKGISLFLLAYQTIAESRNIKLVQKFLGKYSFDHKIINKNSVLW